MSREITIDVRVADGDAITPAEIADVINGNSAAAVFTGIDRRTGEEVDVRFVLADEDDGDGYGDGYGDG